MNAHAVSEALPSTRGNRAVAARRLPTAPRILADSVRKLGLRPGPCA